MAKFITNGTQAEEIVKNGTVRETKIYAGSCENNLSDEKAVVVASAKFDAKTAAWKNTEGHDRLWSEIHKFQSAHDVKRYPNSATAPTPTELAGFYPKLFIDVQRQADQLINLQPLIAKVFVRDDIQKISYTRDYDDFVGKENEISGNNDTVPLIEQNTASTEQIVQKIKAFGFKDSLANLLFNPIAYLQKVTSTAATVSTDYKNNDIIAPIVNGTYGAKHSQAADATGSTYDLRLYNTLRKAYKTLGKLKHPMYVNKLVATLPEYGSNVSLLINPQDAFSIQGVLSGFTFTGSAFVQNVGALPIKNVITYGGGIQDGLDWHGETLSLPGVEAGTAYMFIPNQAYIATKRDTTMESGNGTALELSSKEMAWYRASGLNTTWLLGGGATNTGYGCVVKITLPTE